MEHFLHIVTKPDNIPIVGLMFLVVFYCWYGFRQAFANDRVLGTDEFAKRNPTDKVFVWPYLTRNEFLASLVVMIILTVWSIVVNAPLEEPANPARTPNPSKAPWYFLGLQEMLVYFDPWVAGVVLPTLIIVGLMAIPYIDRNPKGNGYYTWKERQFAIGVFVFGFLILWIALIILGTFIRGAGWNLFWPWEYWDTHKVVALTNVDLPYFFGFRNYWTQFAFGGSVIVAYYVLGLVHYRHLRKKDSPILKQLGTARYAVTVFLFLTMMALPIKMILRIMLNIKYIWVTPWFNI